jgi:hypothetical protein
MTHPAVLRPLGFAAVPFLAILLAFPTGPLLGQVRPPQPKQPHTGAPLAPKNSVPGAADVPSASTGALRLKHVELRTALLAAKPTPGSAGSAVPVKLMVDAVPVRAGLPAGVVFKNSATGEVAAALKAVGEFLTVRHHGLPAGQKLEVTVVGDATPNDLASCSFAAAVAIDALLAGWTPDPSLAVIGAIRADGDLGPVSNPIPRLLAAMRGGAQRVLLPEKSFQQITDVLVSEGPAAFAKTQIFTISNFDDAPSIASASPNAAIIRAIRRFADVERMLSAAGPNADAALREAPLKEALRDVLTTAPSHMSARLLLGRTTGQYTTLSIEGSLTALEAMCTTMLKAARSRNPTDLTQLPLPAVQAETTRLEAARTRLDTKAQPVADALLVYADVIKAWHERPPANASQQGERFRSLSAAARQILAEIGRAKAPGPS